MPLQALVREIDQLKKVGERLQILADDHPSVTEALLTIAGHVLNTATLLQVLIESRLAPETK